VLADLVTNQFQVVNFTGSFWSNKSELESEVNMKIVPCHNKNKYAQESYHEAKCVVQKLLVKMASQNGI
jgi:hypothetical protein